MNILFYTWFKVSPTKGGTERTTISVATGLKKFFDVKCYSVYSVEAETPQEKCFEMELCWKRQNGQNKLSEFIKKYHIEWIIDQGDFRLAPLLNSVVKDTGCKVAFVHHFEPGWEENFFLFPGVVESFLNSTTWMEYAKRMAKVVLYPIFRQLYVSNLPRQYKRAYETSNIVVLLSKDYIPQFLTYGNISVSDENKFRFVPNALSYADYLGDEKMSAKKLVVLIVSRLDETQKRLSLALHIWNEAKKNPELEGWQLKIVGHGRDEKMYRKMIREMDIPDVYLEGRQEPKPYYEEASVFMMTSKSEGWPLTLNEAHQFGVVPIAFDSFASLKESISNDEDGIIIPECDVDLYVNKLVDLMKNHTRRQQLALNGIKNCKRFSQEEIAKKWWKVLNGI